MHMLRNSDELYLVFFKTTMTSSVLIFQADLFFLAEFGYGYLKT